MFLLFCLSGRVLFKVTNLDIIVNKISPWKNLLEDQTVQDEYLKIKIKTKAIIINIFTMHAYIYTFY